ncbi:MAG TPA: polysaccharide deacetylase family protein [Myxococcota bacterium]|nr:polysaccharide deacetylase family protein [Myxococcota bacterium]
MNGLPALGRGARHRIRDAGAELLWALGRTRPARSARGALTIVTFHRVLPPEDLASAPLPGLCVTPRFLDGSLAFFARHFRCLGVSDAVRDHARGAASEKPLLAISFDDGRADSFLHARPLLAKHRVPATFYVVANAVERAEPLWPDALALEVQALAARGAAGRYAIAEIFDAPISQSAPERELPKLAANVAKAWPAARIAGALARLREASGGAKAPSWERAMSWSELAQLAAEGHELGSHSASHAILLRECAPDLAAETSGSRHALEAKLGVSVRSFCYPSGLYDDDARAAVAAAGYENATTTRSGVNRAGAPPFELRRVEVDGTLNARRDGSASESVLAWRLARDAP